MKNCSDQNTVKQPNKARREKQVKPQVDQGLIAKTKADIKTRDNLPPNLNKSSSKLKWKTRQNVVATFSHRRGTGKEMFYEEKQSARARQERSNG